MKIAISGSRTITDKDWVYAQLNYILSEVPNAKHITILSGGAKGVETLAKDWAKDKKLDFVEFKPYHLLDGKAKFEPKYFFVRNRQLVDNADIVVTLYSGASSDTNAYMDYAARKGKHLVTIERT